VYFVVAEVNYVILLSLVCNLKFYYRIKSDGVLVYRLPAFASVVSRARESTLAVRLTSTTGVLLRPPFANLTT